MRGGKAYKACIPGGVSMGILGRDQFDAVLDFDIGRYDLMGLGTCCPILCDQDTDMVAVARNISRFFRNESCGKCVPCRVGTEKAVGWMEERPCTPELVAELRELHHTLERTSICGLGQVALAPLLSILERFPDSTAGE